MVNESIFAPNLKFFFLLKKPARKKFGRRLLLDFSSPEFFLARLDFFLPPLTAPGSSRMVKVLKSLNDRQSDIFLKF